MSPIDRLRKAIIRVNKHPSKKQIDAGNYTKGHVSWRGLEISIENPKGSVRSGKSKSGKVWSSILPAHYGYFKRTVGNDNEHIDVYIGPDHSATKVFVIDQKHHDTGDFDEHKVCINFPDLNSAKKAYRDAFSDDKDRIMSVTAMSLSRFKQWLRGDTKRPLRYFSGE